MAISEIVESQQLNGILDWVWPLDTLKRKSPMVGRFIVVHEGLQPFPSRLQARKRLVITPAKLILNGRERGADRR